MLQKPPWIWRITWYKRDSQRAEIKRERGGGALSLSLCIVLRVLTYMIESLSIIGGWRAVNCQSGLWYHGRALYSQCMRYGITNCIMSLQLNLIQPHILCIRGQSLHPNWGKSTQWTNHRSCIDGNMSRLKHTESGTKIFIYRNHYQLPQLIEPIKLLFIGTLIFR